MVRAYRIKLHFGRSDLSHGPTLDAAGRSARTCFCAFLFLTDHQQKAAALVERPLPDAGGGAPLTRSHRYPVCREHRRHAKSTGVERRERGLRAIDTWISEEESRKHIEAGEYVIHIHELKSGEFGRNDCMPAASQHSCAVRHLAC